VTVEQAVNKTARRRVQKEERSIIPSFVISRERSNREIFFIMGKDFSLALEMTILFFTRKKTWRPWRFSLRLGG
jgi:hypothetical protein